MDELLKQIKQALADFWDDRALPGSFEGASTVEELVAPVESMTAVEVLATLDVIVGETIPNTVIQAGGYSSKDEFIEKLSENVISHIAGKK